GRYQDQAPQLPLGQPATRRRAECGLITRQCNCRCHLQTSEDGRQTTDERSVRRRPLSILRHPATCLIRAIISSTACSTLILSFTTRLAAFAHTFSLLRMVNL